MAIVPKKPGAASAQVAIRLDPALLEEADGLVDFLTERQGIQASRMAVLREAVVRGLQAMKQERGEKMAIEEQVPVAAGDWVVAGKTAEDLDYGQILSVANDIAKVAWSCGERTEYDLEPDHVEVFATERAAVARYDARMLAKKKTRRG